MRTLTWCLGLVVLNAWGDVSHQLGHRVPAGWWGWLVLWIFLGAAEGVISIVRWFLGKYKAGALDSLHRAGAGAPAGLKGDE